MTMTEFRPRQGTVASLIRSLATDDGMTRLEHEQRTRDFQAMLRAKAAVDWVDGSPLGTLGDYDQLLELVQHEAVAAALAGESPAPFSTPLPVVTAPAAASWVGPQGAKPLTVGAFESVTLAPLKVSSIAVVEQELVENSSPAADAAVRRIIADAARRALNSTFLSDAAAVADTSPAGALNGITPVAGTGFGDDTFFVDLIDFLDGVEVPILIGASAYMIAALAKLGRGAELLARTLVAEEAGGSLIAIDASRILVAFGGINIMASGEAAIEMSDAPNMPAQTVSMFQTNGIALRVDVWSNWWIAPGAARALEIDAS